MIHDIATEMNEAILSHVKALGKVSPCRSNRASEIGHPCLRYLCYTRVAWRDKSVPDPTLQIIFNDGNLHERATTRIIEDAGYEIAETQKSFEWPLHQITGHIDGKVYARVEGKRESIPIEIKSCNDATFRTINSQEDLYSGKRFWVEKWGGQIQTYLLLDDKPHGLLILKNKAPAGVFPIKVIPISLDYERAERLIQRAEAVNEVVEVWVAEEAKSGTSPEALEALLPERVSPDEALCGRCPFLHRCMGVRTFGPELIILTEDELLDLAIRREELYPLQAEYKEKDKRLKTALKNLGENFLIGDQFQARVTTSSNGAQRVSIDRISK